MAHAPAQERVCDRRRLPSKGERGNAVLCGRMPRFDVLEACRHTITRPRARCALDVLECANQRIPSGADAARIGRDSNCVDLHERHSH
jgi:hypothetical protein